MGGKSPVDRGKIGTKRSVLTDGKGIPLGCVEAPANRHDSPLLRPTLEKLSRFGFHLPQQITVHLDAGYDSSKTHTLLKHHVAVEPPAMLADIVPKDKEKDYNSRRVFASDKYLLGLSEIHSCTADDTNFIHKQSGIIPEIIE